MLYKGGLFLECLDIEEDGVPPPLFSAILSQKSFYFTLRAPFLMTFCHIYTTFLYITKILLHFYFES